MAIKVFDAKQQGHNCRQEIGQDCDSTTSSHGDVVRCSCGEFYVWRIEQRESYWMHVDREHVVRNIKSLNPTLSEDDILMMLTKA